MYSVMSRNDANGFYGQPVPHGYPVNPNGYYGNPMTPEDFPEAPSAMQGDYRPSLLAMHRAITDLGHWTAIGKKPTGGSFVWTQDNLVREIGNHPLVLESGHSGASLALCLRIMLKISREGWKAYVDSFTIVQVE